MTRTRGVVALLLTTALLLAGCTSTSGGEKEDDAPEPLPDVTLAALQDGPSENLSDLQGPMVINLFAQWCGPCRKELPYYQELHEKAGKKVRVLGIDYLDQQPDKARTLVDNAGVTYPLLTDPDGELRLTFRAVNLPIVAFVDADGRIVHIEERLIDSYAELSGLVEEHLGVAL